MSERDQTKPNQIDGIEYFSIKLFISNRYFLTSILFGIINGLMREEKKIFYYLNKNNKNKKKIPNDERERENEREKNAIFAIFMLCHN